MLFRQLALALFCALSTCAAESIEFAAELVDPPHNISGSANLTLSSNVVTYSVSLPGSWIAGARGPHPGERSNHFRLSYQGVLVLTDAQITEMLDGRWTVNAALAVDDGGLPKVIFLQGQILPVDRDNDGVFDYLDACPDTPIGEVVNDNGCSIEQLCPCDGPWKSRGHYLNTVLTVTKEFVTDRLITPRERNAILAAAVKSPCGWRRRR